MLLSKRYDKEGVIQSVVIKIDNNWTRKWQTNLLEKQKMTNLRGNKIKLDKDEAFDLLDALSRSGLLLIACSELHAIISLSY